MKAFDVQGIDIAVPRERAFALISDPAKLPQWAEAFESVAAGKAIMRTPQGQATVGLAVDASAAKGTVDWHMTFPDGGQATAYSRLIALGADRCAFTFVLTPPPVPLEQLEGALESQSRTLTRELKALKRLLESNGA